MNFDSVRTEREGVKFERKVEGKEQHDIDMMGRRST
jgi:hypothetical protein